MNGFGRKGLKFAYALFLVMYILFIIFFAVIFVGSITGGYGDYKYIYPVLISGIIGIVISIFAKKALDKYKKGSRTSPLWLFSLMSMMIAGFPAGLIISANIDEFNFRLIFESYYTISLFVFLVIAIYLLIANIFKSKILICFGCLLISGAYASGIYWQLKYVIFTDKYTFDYMFPQIMKPYTYLCVLLYLIMAITTFIMFFSLFSKVNKSKDDPKALKTENKETKEDFINPEEDEDLES